MIDAKELRIGNIIRLNNPEHQKEFHGRLCIVQGVQSNHVNGEMVFLKVAGKLPLHEQCVSELTQIITFIDPVLLTPELLEKCANNKVGKDGYRIAVSLDRMQSLFITPSANGWVVELFSFGTSKPLHRLHYLHQLQNLIYILSGNELNVEI